MIFAEYANRFPGLAVGAVFLLDAPVFHLWHGRSRRAPRGGAAD